MQDDKVILQGSVDKRFTGMTSTQMVSLGTGAMSMTHDATPLASMHAACM